MLSPRDCLIKHLDADDDVVGTCYSTDDDDGTDLVIIMLPVQTHLHLVHINVRPCLEMRYQRLMRPRNISNKYLKYIFKPCKNWGKKKEIF